MDGLPCIVTHVSGREHEQCPQSGPAQGTSTTRHESSQAVKGNRVSGMPLALHPRMTNLKRPSRRLLSADVTAAYLVRLASVITFPGRAPVTLPVSTTNFPATRT